MSLASHISGFCRVSLAVEMAVLSETTWPMAGAIPCLLFY